MADNLDLVRWELASRVSALSARTARARTPDLIAAVDEIRVLARAYGFAPAVTVVQFISAGLARGERGAAVHGWLPMLRDAVGAERHDAATCDAFAAACAVRLAH